MSEQQSEGGVNNSNRDPRFRPIMRSVGHLREPRDKRLEQPKIALVRGPTVSTDRALNNEATPAIGLAYILGFLRRHGYEANLVDSIAEGVLSYWQPEDIPNYHCQGLTLEETIERIPAGTKIIGFSTMFSGEWPVQRTLISLARVRFPEAVFIAGGEHATALSEFMLRECPALDFCVRGEGELTFFEIVNDISLGGDGCNVPGVAYIDNEGYYREAGGLTRVNDIDGLGWPHWPDGYLEQFWKAGKSYGVQTERDMPLMISRGCPFQCTFCSSPRMWTTRYMLRDVDDVIAEMKYYIERFGATAFQLYDLTAITKKSWAVELCNRMISDDIRVNWSLPSGTRSEALDQEVVSLLKKTGCNYLVYAPESGSVRTLEKIKKKISLNDLTRSALTAKNVGLILRTNLIIGFPDETRVDVLQTIRFGLYLAIRGVDEVSINIFSPYPGSELFEMIHDAGKVHLSDEYFLNLTSLNSDYTKLNPMTVNDAMGARELALYRVLFMMMNYAIGYLIYPSRIVRTIRNLWFGGHAATVFEHRLKNAKTKRRSTKKGSIQ